MNFENAAGDTENVDNLCQVRWRGHGGRRVLGGSRGHGCSREGLRGGEDENEDDIGDGDVIDDYGQDHVTKILIIMRILQVGIDSLEAEEDAGEEY